jgi:hypothetical protein
METITNIPFLLDSATLMERVHIRPGSSDAQEIEDLLLLARQVGNPKAIYTEAYVEFHGEDTTLLNSFRFISSMLRQNLTNIDRVFAFVVTCGHEMDQVGLDNRNILTQYRWDAIKESLLMSAYQYLQDLLERRYLLKKTSSMSPGSGDVNIWPIEQQRELFELLGDVHGQIGVELTDSFLMVPNKTVSGILFPTEKDFRTCQVCHRENCTSRSAAFDQTLWESIQPNENKPETIPYYRDEDELGSGRQYPD